ncbi:MAG: J domain-containing protein [Balneolales bacterium]
MEYKDYYKTLGISKTATQDEIKKAYRKLAARYHPDVNPDDKGAAKKFKEVAEAYEVFKNPEDRKMYDEMGSDWKQYKRSGGQAQDFNWQEWSRQRGRPKQRTYTYQGGPGFEEQFSGESPFSDFFESFFGGGGAGAGMGEQPGTARRREQTKGRDLNAELEITLNDVYHGSERSFILNGQRYKVKVPPGIESGKRLKLKGKGEPSPATGSSGDLYIKLNIQPHPTFRRDGDNLHVELPVDLYTAVLGGTINVPALDKQFNIKVPPETQQGKILRLSGRGMPNFRSPSQRGNLYVKLIIKIPENLTEKEKKLFRQLAELRR